MKTDILKALRRLRLPALALAAFLASCTSELAHEPAPGGGSQAGEALVTLRLQVPGAAAAGKTRAITAEAENKVDDLYILAFKVDPDAGTETFEYYVAAKQLTPTDATTGQSTWTASLKVKEYNQTFVMVANALGTNSKVNEQIADLVKEGATNKVGLEKMEVLKGLTEMLAQDEIENGFNATSHPLTMYGQTQAVQIGLDKTVTLTVALHRIMARVQVKFEGNAAVATNFSAEEVRLYNFNDRARVIPTFLQETTGADYEQTVTIPDDAELYPKTQDGTETVPTYAVTANKVENTIYLFEAAQPQLATDEENHLKRPCIIVKGVYEGKSCYYRVDFAKQDATTGDVTYMDIVRNHSYNITVTNVSGRGSATLQEAMETKASNLTADMILWDDNVIGNIDFEGDRVLGISTNRYELIKSGGIKLLQVRATKNVTWTANIYAANADGSADTQGTRPAWINFTNADGNAQGDGKTLADQAGVDALQDIYFKVEVNDERPERQAVIRLTDERGRLSVEAVVTQDQTSIPVFLNVKQLGVPVTEMDFGQNGETPLTHLDIEFGPADVKLTWEIKEDPDASRMDVTETSINAGANYTTDMKGEVTSVGDTHQLQFRGKATNVADDPDVPYETRTATLTLIAQHTTSGEIVVQNIRLFQKKLGLVIDRTEVLCGGQEALIYVKGNMPWIATFSEHTDAINAGLIPNTNDAGTGNPSETNWSAQSCIRIKTTARPRTRETFAAKLNFSHKTTGVAIPAMDITFRGGVLAVDEVEDNSYVTNIYDVYGPVERSFNTKDNPYTDVDTGTEIPEAKMMNYWQASALTQAEPTIVWGMCKESELIHEYYAQDNRGTEISKSSNGSITNKFGFATGANGGSLTYIKERIKVTYAGSYRDKEVVTQELLEIAGLIQDSRHSHLWITGTPQGDNLMVNVEEVGRMVKNQWNVDVYKPIYQNVKWEYYRGNTGVSIPTAAYGTSRFDTHFKPTSFYHQDIAGGQYLVGMKRSNEAITRLDAEQYKQEPYQTYYFELIK